ncbi:hypothetical protein RF11_07626 [Thelohanellus kitauei]|uniref:Uncharacterized protein n=1 Tax=Thelohanellus kitauei TaxID=669202 RepID=A0A0C2NMF5_THEKT|nr:hypothetical protein RF11_07626 [Thelohanellus kitauei]
MISGTLVIWHSSRHMIIHPMKNIFVDTSWRPLNSFCFQLNTRIYFHNEQREVPQNKYDPDHAARERLKKIFKMKNIVKPASHRSEVDIFDRKRLKRITPSDGNGYYRHMLKYNRSGYS